MQYQYKYFTSYFIHKIDVSLLECNFINCQTIYKGEVFYYDGCFSDNIQN